MTDEQCLYTLEYRFNGRGKGGRGGRGGRGGEGRFHFVGGPHFI